MRAVRMNAELVINKVIPRVNPKAIPLTSVGLVLAALLASFASEKAHAAPTIEVRARTIIDLQPILRTQSGIVISGRVTDRATPEPVPNAVVVIELDGQMNTVTADSTGRFELDLPASQGQHTLAVSFPGDRYFDPTVETLENFDVTNEPLDLQISANMIAETRWEISVRASSVGQPAQIEVNLWGGDLTASELKRFGKLTTDARGRATQTLTREQLGGFGDKRIEARFIGDDSYDAAIASTRFAIGAKTVVEFSISATTVAFEDDVVGRGRVLDQEGEPLARQRVVLEAGNRDLDETTTDDKGKFKVLVEASELGEGKTQLQATVFPQERYLSIGRSEPVTVEIGDPKPIPVAATIAAFGATCIALLAFVFLRTKPWVKWLERFRRREPREKDDGDKPGKKRRLPGLATARPSLVSTLRRPNDFGFSGSVVDVRNGRAISAATISVRPSGGGAALSAAFNAATDDNGTFSLEDLGPGTWTAVVTARYYIAEEFELVVPHRGELRNARVDLLSVREHVFDLYGDVAKPLLPKKEQWGVWTPRQIFEHVRTSRRAGALRSLTDSVEEMYFSQRSPDVDVLDATIAQIAEVEREVSL